MSSDSNLPFEIERRRGTVKRKERGRKLPDVFVLPFRRLSGKKKEGSPKEGGQ